MIVPSTAQYCATPSFAYWAWHQASGLRLVSPFWDKSVTVDLANHDNFPSPPSPVSIESATSTYALNYTIFAKLVTGVSV